MNSGQNQEQIRQLLKLLANPVTKSVLYILVGLDPGRLSKKVLYEIADDSWEMPDQYPKDPTDYGNYWREK